MERDHRARLHLHWPYPVETALFPKVTKVNEVALGEVVAASGAAPSDRDRDRDRQMLTGDENIVEAD